MKRRLIDLPKEFFKLPLPEKLLARLTQQKPLNHFFARFPPLNTRYPKPTTRKVKRNGIHYELDLSDYMEWLVFWGIQVEPRRTLYQLVKPGSIVIDVGANIGEVSMNLAQLVGPSGFVHSFEPDTATFRKLNRNVALNNFVNLRINPIGLGDRDEQLVLQTEVPSNRGGSRIHRHLSQGQRVQVITLDSYVTKQQPGPVSLIKIDVEGFELHVLRGAEHTLRQYKPVLFIELDDDNLRDQGDSATELVRFLEKRGYQTIKDAATGTSVSTGTSFTHCHMDIMASQ
ncbi:MAG: FkbM family methyltransferase [Cyclobacteriaceae bacterium]|nr:FkbM family methyltransferase [Cyclobacteriaceae bacterium]